MQAAFYACPALFDGLFAGRWAQGMRAAGVGGWPHYNPVMDKPIPRRQLRRTAWWVAFAALAGFLLADLT
ncbi:conserved protein of unknown function [Cupriavidus taiwanensis]|uniref:Uncharacterized protein n=1 Tax=Cupriavidus taiwanensis TaxID=164546 RepID=A0A9Q7UW27_9BURK|nr:hypothetical protein [Cupriavidus taiwanensis]SPD65834.1 conserved protein of unknown function [Cupriavidus taiwanensis]